MAGKIGRPSIYTQEQADTICERMAGGRSLRSVCRDEDTPCKTTVMKWLNDVDGFADQYARAAEDRADSMFEDLIDIADDSAGDWAENEVTGEKRFDSEHVQRSKLRVDARKWALSKMMPKKYGDRTHTEHSGSLGVASILEELDGSTKGLPGPKE